MISRVSNTEALHHQQNTTNPQRQTPHNNRQTTLHSSRFTTQVRTPNTQSSSTRRTITNATERARAHAPELKKSSTFVSSVKFNSKTPQRTNASSSEQQNSSSNSNSSSATAITGATYNVRKNDSNGENDDEHAAKSASSSQEEDENEQIKQDERSNSNSRSRTSSSTPSMPDSWTSLTRHMGRQELEREEEIWQLLEQIETYLQTPLDNSTSTAPFPTQCSLPVEELNEWRDNFAKLEIVARPVLGKRMKREDDELVGGQATEQQLVSSTDDEDENDSVVNYEYHFNEYARHLEEVSLSWSSTSTLSRRSSVENSVNNAPVSSSSVDTVSFNAMKISAANSNNSSQPNIISSTTTSSEQLNETSSDETLRPPTARQHTRRRRRRRTSSRSSFSSNANTIELLVPKSSLQKIQDSMLALPPDSVHPLYCRPKTAHPRILNNNAENVGSNSHSKIIIRQNTSAIQKSLPFNTNDSERRPFSLKAQTSYRRNNNTNVSYDKNAAGGGKLQDSFPNKTLLSLPYYQSKPLHDAAYGVTDDGEEEKFEWQSGARFLKKSTSGIHTTSIAADDDENTLHWNSKHLPNLLARQDPTRGSGTMNTSTKTSTALVPLVNNTLLSAAARDVVRFAIPENISSTTKFQAAKLPALKTPPATPSGGGNSTHRPRGPLESLQKSHLPHLPVVASWRRRELERPARKLPLPVKTTSPLHRTNIISAFSVIKKYNINNRTSPRQTVADATRNETSNFNTTNRPQTRTTSFQPTSPEGLHHNAQERANTTPLSALSPPSTSAGSRTSYYQQRRHGGTATRLPLSAFTATPPELLLTGTSYQLGNMTLNNNGRSDYGGRGTIKNS